ncbi:MAG: F0F1 ATP synthase subunit B [Oscillospiraceae bacterium]|nr:F0F1 ATP synthase subunit B [Oscillospiraceae bacterium]
MKYLEFFTIDVWTMIFTLVNMFIVYVIVKKLLFKPVLKVLDRRDAEIKKIYVDANEANAKAQTLEKEYSEKMANAKDEAGEIIKQATLSAHRREQEIISAAQEKATLMTKKAEAEIEQERKKAYRDIRNDISDISVAIAGKMVKKEISARDHASLIDEFIENVGE